MLYVCRTIESEVRVYLRKRGVPMKLNNYWMGFTVIHVFFCIRFVCHVVFGLGIYDRLLLVLSQDRCFYTSKAHTKVTYSDRHCNQ